MSSKVNISNIDCVPQTPNIFSNPKDGSFIELHGAVVPSIIGYDDCGCACVRRDGFAPQLVIIDCELTSITSQSMKIITIGLQRETSPGLVSSNGIYKYTVTGYGQEARYLAEKHLKTR